MNLTEEVMYLATRCLWWGRVHQIRDNPEWSSNTFDHQLSLEGGMSDHRSAWPTVWSNVNLTWSLILRGGRYIWPKVSLTWRSDKKCQPGPSLISGGYIWPKVSLTLRCDKNVNLTWNLIYVGFCLTKC